LSGNTKVNPGFVIEHSISGYLPYQDKENDLTSFIFAQKLWATADGHH